MGRARVTWQRRFWNGECTRFAFLIELFSLPSFRSTRLDARKPAISHGHLRVPTKNLLSNASAIVIHGNFTSGLHITYFDHTFVGLILVCFSNALQNRLPPEQSDYFLRVAAVQLYRETSFLLCELVDGPSLHCVVNAFKTCGERIDEATIVWLLLQISEAISQMHSCGVIHGDIKTENILLSNLDTLSLNACGEVDFLRARIKIIDFGSSVDAALYPPGTMFKGDAGTDTFGCEAAKNGLEWVVEPDLAGIAGTAHCLLFCEYMELAQKTTESGVVKARPTRPFKRYWDVAFWEKLFDLLINEEGTAQDVADLCLKFLNDR
jgi:serine/threonine protein kinase